jgi:Tfp pilus assembly protein PilF
LIAARAEAGAKDFPAAERSLRRAVQIDPSLLTGYVMLGQLYYSQGRLDDARREFETLAERQAKPVAALTMLGIIAQAQNNPELARKSFERVIDIDPRAPVAANNLAWMYAERGERLDVALELAKAAADALPKMAEVRDTLGWVYYKRQTSDQAIAALQESVRLDPRNPTYHYHLGLAYVQDGNVARARESLERALSLPRFSAEADARRALAGLAATPASAGR